MSAAHLDVVLGVHVLGQVVALRVVLPRVMGRRVPRDQRRQAERDPRGRLHGCSLL